MSGLVTVPNTFGPLGPTIALNLLDANYAALVAYINDPTNRVVFATDSGAANAYVIAPSPAITSYARGTLICFSTANLNTAASTININGLGIVTLYKLVNGAQAALVTGDILANRLYLLAPDGANVCLVNPSNLLAPPTLLTRTVAAAAASVDFTSLSTAYSYFKLFCIGLQPATNDALLLARVSIAAAFKSDANYDNNYVNNASGTVTGVTTGIAATSFAIGAANINDGSHIVNAELTLFNPSSVAQHKQVHWTSYALSSGGTRTTRNGGGFYNNIAAVDGIQVLMSAGNLTGIVELWGYQ